MRFPRFERDGSHVLYLVESQAGDHSFPASLITGSVIASVRGHHRKCAFFSMLAGSDHVLSRSIWSTVQVARLREFRMADLIGVSPRMDRGLHSSSNLIEFDFYHRTPVPLTM